MRVIGGYYKGIRLITPAGRDIRPTSDRVRESLFNILSPGLEGVHFLDVFAGSGSVGIEALSRGAELSVFIENNTGYAKIIKENLVKVKADSKAVILKYDVIHGLKKLAEKGWKADLIFVDPPYRNVVKILPGVLKTINEESLLRENGVVIIEHFKKTDILTDEGWTLIKRRHYGNTVLSFINTPKLHP